MMVIKYILKIQREENLAVVYNIDLHSYHNKF